MCKVESCPYFLIHFFKVVPVSNRLHVHIYKKICQLKRHKGAKIKIGANLTRMCPSEAGHFENLKLCVTLGYHKFHFLPVFIEVVQFLTIFTVCTNFLY
jgi:hypothetical protein